MWAKIEAKRKLWISATSGFLAVLLLLTLVLTMGGTANAATAPISYSNAQSLAAGGIYGKESSSGATTSITAPVGFQIAKVTMTNLNGLSRSINEPVGKTSWTGSIGIISGKKIDVISKSNLNQTYYAWDRYSGDRGKVWYAGTGNTGCSQGPISSPSNGGLCMPDSAPKYTTYNGVSMPDYPAVIDKSLKLYSTVSERYNIVGTSKIIPFDLVATPQSTDIVADETDKEVLFAPKGDKARMGLTVSNLKATMIESSTRYMLTFTAAFNQSGDLAYPSYTSEPRTYIYVFAFVSQVTSNTYEYPATVDVEYKPISQVTEPVVSGTTPTPSLMSITGDFDILPGYSINYRDSFSLKPKNIIETGGCTYNSHVFRLVNGSTYAAPRSRDRTQLLEFRYPNLYPAPISVGSVTVQMQITGTGCQSDWISKSLTVNGPQDNQPPYFKLGWFLEGDYSSTLPLTQVIQGTKVHVRYIDDPNSTPISPSDPEGDPIHITGWDYGRSSNWIADLPMRYSSHPWPIASPASRPIRRARIPSTCRWPIPLGPVIRQAQRSTSFRLTPSR